jgi:hypothetical protein
MNYYCYCYYYYCYYYHYHYIIVIIALVISLPCQSFSAINTCDIQLPLRWMTPEHNLNIFHRLWSIVDFRYGK